MPKMPRWYWWIPGNVYALGPTEAQNKAEALQDLRDWLGVTRLPNGAGVWKAGDPISYTNR